MNSTKKSIFNVVIIASFINLIGCSLTEIKTVKDPASPISFRETPVTKELACFGDMLTTYKRLKVGNPVVSESASLIPIAVVSVTDKTGVSNTTGFSEIPLDMRDMAIGSVAKIGGSLRILHIPNADEYTMANQYKASLGSVDTKDANNIAKSFFSNFNVRHYSGGTSTILMYGSLTEYDIAL